MSEFTEAEKEALAAYRPREYKHTSGLRTHVQVPRFYRDISVKYENLAPNQLGLGGGIGGGLGYVLSNRLKNPNVTRHALMSVTFGIFGFNVVQFTGIKVIRVYLHRDGPESPDF